MAFDDNDIYNTEPQLAFARQIARQLMAPQAINPALMAQPNGWMSQSIPNLINAFAGNQYAGVSGRGEDALIRGMVGKGPRYQSKFRRFSGAPGAPGASSPVTTGSLPPSGGAPTSSSLFEGMDPNQNQSQLNQGQSAIDDDYVRGLIGIESSGNPRARTGSNRGLGQFGPSEEKRYGINNDNWTDPATQDRAIRSYAEDARQAFVQEFGREPTRAELYFMHQQGVAGGIALLKNPDKAAWETLKPYYKNSDTALSAISGNIPRNDPQKNAPEGVTGGEFFNMWSNRFDREVERTRPRQAQSPNRLGGPTPEGGEPDNFTPNVGQGTGNEPPPPNLRMAQSAPYTSTPAQPNFASQPQNATPGYQGPLPPAPPLASTDQLEAQLRSASPEQRQRIIEDYQNRAQGKAFPTPGGGNLIATPGAGGQPPTYTSMPGPDIPLGIAGMDLRMRQNPDGSVRLLLPGGGTKDFGSVSDLMEYARQQKALDIRTTGRASEITQKYAKMEDDIHRHSISAGVNQNMLQMAKSFTNDPNFYSGTGANRVLDYKKMASYITGNPNWSGSIEAFGKVLARSNIEGLEAFKSLGQIRNPEIQLLQESAGNLQNTPGALQAIIQMNMKASQRLQEIGDQMRIYRRNHGQLDEGFDEQMAAFYKNNPLYSDDEIKNYRELFKMEKDKDKNPWVEVPGMPGVRRRKREE